MDVRRIVSLTRFWDALNPLDVVRDPIATLLHPYAFGQGENIESRIRAAQFIAGLPRTTKRILSPYLMRDWTVGVAAPKGLFMEFGVAGGESTNQIAERLSQLGIRSQLYGFDSFLGLSQDWRRGVLGR